MIKLTINGKDYQVKNSWTELTYNDYIKVLSSASMMLTDRINLLTGIPKDICDKLSFQQLAFICDALLLFDEPEDILLFTKGYIDELNIGRRTYKELEECLIFIRKVKNPVAALDKVVKILYGEEIGELKAVEVLPKGLFILTCITKFLDEFKRLGDYEPTIEEQEAGVEELGKFGFFATAVQLARKYGKTHDDILAMPAREVYTTLLYDFEQSEIEKRLQKIHSRKR